MFMHQRALVALVLALVTTPAAAQPSVDSASARSTVSATRTTQLPRLDGKNDDAVWLSSPRISDFVQFEPRVNAAPAFRTEFQVAYDARNLYVFTRMYDPHPDSILHALSRRDVRGPSDQIKLIVDSYDDKRTGFEFAVNPDGVKRDFSISDDGNENESWNGIWDVATTVDALGWTAEFRIPLSQLRYAGGTQHTFGFGVWRDIERFKEREAWPAYSPVKSGLSSQLGRLTALEGISSARHIEVTPYAVTRNELRTLPANRFGRDQKATAGADLKVSITPNVTLDATVNPDFGQVEADPAVLNLGAFETFVSEKRPFFVEGTGLYQFQLNCYIVVDCSTNEGLFYSRRIGRSPSLRNQYGDVTTATSTAIAVATKLTGRTRSGLSFGALDAVTQQVRGPNRSTVEPGTNYALLRAQQDFRGGEAGIGLIGTAVNRTMDDFTDPYLHASAYATGASMRNRFHKREYEVAAQVTASEVQGTAEAVSRTQRNPVHYFQQPDDDAALDSARRTLGGHSEQVKFGKYGGGISRFETSVQRTSIGFDVNDIGFLRRADLMDWSTWGALTFRNAHGIYKWGQVNANHWETFNTSGARLENAVNLNGHLGFTNNWDVHLGGTLSALTPSYCDRCTRGGPLLRKSRGFSPWGGINSDSRQPVSGGVWVNLSSTDEGLSHGASVSPYLNFRMSTRFQASLGADISQNIDNSQWYDNFVDTTGGTPVTHYTFAHLNQNTVSLSMRLNYTVTPDLTFEFYGQPFVAKGTYTDARETSATPRDAYYADRFQPYLLPDNAATAFRLSQLRTNAVARWEFRPGSTLFVVWTHGRAERADENPRQSWQTDYRELFRLHPDNTFLVKLAYWVSR